MTAPPRVEEVSDGVFAYVQPDGSWWINNAGFLRGVRGVICIDSASTQLRTEALRAAIAAACPGPVLTMVNTHHHGDHTNGNHQFAGATIVGHRLCREQILAVGAPGARQARTWDGPDWGAVTPAPPFLTFTGGIELWAAELRCEVFHIGTPAHTTNDCVVWIPDRSVLFAGDLVFNGCTPFLLGGSLAGSITAVQQLAALRPATIVPGHGDVCGPEILDETLAYLRFVEGYAREAHGYGLTPLQAARECDLGRFAGLLDPERIVGNLHRAFAELDGSPVSSAAALADMVAYNGGRRLTCLA